MSKRYKNTFRDKVLAKIFLLGKDVMLRSDFADLRDQRQVSRALKALVEDGELIKFGYGVYVRAEKTQYSEEPIMVIPMAQACTETLDRLESRWQLGQAIRDYNSGKTQQVPARFTVRLKDRFRGRLGTGRREIIFEEGINAR